MVAEMGISRQFACVSLPDNAVLFRLSRCISHCLVFGWIHFLFVSAISNISNFQLLAVRFGILVCG
jgi:hypothetical protein